MSILLPREALDVFIKTTIKAFFTHASHLIYIYRWCTRYFYCYCELESLDFANLSCQVQVLPPYAHRKSVLNNVMKLVGMKPRHPPQEASALSTP